MNYSQKITEYLEKEKREYEELVSRASMPYANEVDEFLAQNALNERVSWRSDLLKKITDKLPEDIAVQAVRKGLGAEYMEKKASYVLSDKYKVTSLPYNQVYDRFPELLDAVAEHIEPEELESFVDELDKYIHIPLRERNDVLHPMQDRVNELKQVVENSQYSPERKTYLTALLDKANEITQVADAEQTQAKSVYSLRISTAIYHESKKTVLAEIEANNTNGMLENSVSNDPSHVSTLGNEEKFAYANTLKVNLAESDKANYLRVLKTMQEHELLRPENHVAGEEGTKIFAFQNIISARNAVAAALEAGDFDALDRASKQYEKDMDAMRDVYRVAAEALGEDLYSFPDNVDVQRNDKIPLEFKQNCKLNAAINSLYLTMGLAREMKVSVEDIINDPVKYSIDYMKQFAKEHSIEKYAEGKTLGQMLASLSNIDRDTYCPTQPMHLTTRVIEGCNVMAKDMTNRSRNFVNEFIVDGVITDYNSQAFRALLFLGVELKESAATMFLMGEEGMRNPSLMCANGHYDLDTFKYTPPVDPVEYATTHRQDPNKLKSYIVQTVNEYLAGAEESSSVVLEALMEGARTAARDAIIFGGLNPKAPETADLIQLFENPEQALISAGVKADLPTIPLVRENIRFQNDLKAIAKNAKKISALDKKTLRAEASYNKKATKLEDKIKKNEEKLKNAKNDKERAKLTKSREAIQEKLDNLKAKELNRLDSVRAQGNITDVYYQRRTGDIKNNNYQNKRDLYTDTKRIDKDEFISEQMKNGCSKKEAKLKYSEVQEKNMVEVRAVAARKTLGLPEKKVELALENPEEANKADEKNTEEKSAEEKNPTVKQLDLSAAIRKVATKQVVNNEQTKVQVRAAEKKIEEQIK